MSKNKSTKSVTPSPATKKAYHFDEEAKKVLPKAVRGLLHRTVEEMSRERAEARKALAAELRKCAVKGGIMPNGRAIHIVVTMRLLMLLWLVNIASNRRVKPRSVLGYAADVLQGLWYMFAPLILTEDWEMCDGQNRVLAMMRALEQDPTLRIEQLVVLKVPLAAMKKIDILDPRTDADAIRMSPDLPQPPSTKMYECFTAMVDLRRTGRPGKTARLALWPLYHNHALWAWTQRLRLVGFVGRTQLLGTLARVFFTNPEGAELIVKELEHTNPPAENEPRYNLWLLRVLMAKLMATDDISLQRRSGWRPAEQAMVDQATRQPGDCRRVIAQYAAAAFHGFLDRTVPGVGGLAPVDPALAFKLPREMPSAIGGDEPGNSGGPERKQPEPKPKPKPSAGATLPEPGDESPTVRTRVRA